MTADQLTPEQGSSVDLAALAPVDRLGALNAAFEYRGDVTLALADGSVVECYVFDRRAASAADPGSVRVLVTATGERRTIPFDRIVRLEFSGKDTAAGKTWENWVRRYVEKRLAGESASIEPESLG